jgi:competence protein ComEA
MSDPNLISSKTRTGIILLTALLLALVVFWRILLPEFIAQDSDEETVALQNEWDKFKTEHFSTTEPDKGEKGSEKIKPGIAEGKKIKMFRFDPNTATEKELLQLGLPENTARNLIKYREAGATFRRKEDLKKLYTLSEGDYERIAPYINIEHVYSRKFTKVDQLDNTPVSVDVDNTPASVDIIELNSADDRTLMQLRGIGPVLSKRIVNFRNKLGGFYSVDQLSEVYGLQDSVYLQIKERLIVNVNHIRLININTVTEEQLAEHSYIGKQLAANLILLRNGLKQFDNIEQIRQTPLINDEKYRKIAPYLTVK